MRARRIPNRVVALLLACGVLYAAVGGPGVGRSLLAAGAGFAIWVPFYAARVLGAGDVKLFAAASAWLAPAAVVQASVLTAAIGGALALLWLVRSQGAGLAVMRLAHAASQPQLLRTPLPVASPRRQLPYGVAMSAGLLVVAWWLTPSF